MLWMELRLESRSADKRVRVREFAWERWTGRWLFAVGCAGPDGSPGALPAQVLDHARRRGVTAALEPEPGMLVETLDDWLLHGGSLPVRVRSALSALRVE